MAEFVVARGIDHEPAFDWLIKHVYKKRDGIVASVRKQQTRFFKSSHKFGIDLFKTVEQALTLNAKNGNNLWADAISKELENVRVEFILPDGNSAPRGLQIWHLILI